MTSFNRRVVLASMIALVAPANFAQAQSGTWPNQPIKWILPVAAGGAADGTARLVAEQLLKILGQPIVIENRPGGSGVVSTDAVVRAAPDGYTFGLAMTPVTAGPALVAKLPYDLQKDIVPVAFLAATRTSWSVSANTPYKTLDELIQKAKSEPGAITYGTGGVGQASHFAGVLLEQSAGVKLTHVPYRGASPAVNDAIGGHLPVVVATTTTAGPHVETGKLRMLAVTAPTRSTLLPNVPTARELGFTNIDSNEWFGLFAPAGVSSAIVQKMNSAIREAVSQPELAAKLAKMDLATENWDPDQFAKFFFEDVKKIGEIAKAAGINPQ